VDDSLDFLRSIDPEYMRNIDALYSYGVAENPSHPRYDDQKYWSNPLESTLPQAPKLKIYCLYGVGIDTERGYWYQSTDPDQRVSNQVPYMLDTSVNSAHGRIKNGVTLTNGDGTVPLLSLGYMCTKGWKLPRYNPANVTTITREYVDNPRIKGFANQHKGVNFLRRVTSADHVDILGNYEMIADILRIVGTYNINSSRGQHQLGSLGDVINSPILDLAQLVQLP